MILLLPRGWRGASRHHSFLKSRGTPEHWFPLDNVMKPQHRSSLKSGGTRWYRSPIEDRGMPRRHSSIEDQGMTQCLSSIKDKDMVQQRSSLNDGRVRQCHAPHLWQGRMDAVTPYTAPYQGWSHIMTPLLPHMRRCGSTHPS